MSPFVSPLSTITWAHNPTVIGSVALRKCPRRFCLHYSDRCCTLMLTCPNSPLWQGCERCSNVLSSSWPPWLTQSWSVEQHGHHVTCALIETSHKLAATSWKIQTESVKVSKGSDLEPATRSVVVTWLFGKLGDRHARASASCLKNSSFNFYHRGAVYKSRKVLFQTHYTWYNHFCPSMR